jgi:hypothetical protein
VSNKAADFLSAILPALGMGATPVQRVVIDADVLGGPVRVYVKAFAPDGSAQAVAGAVAAGEVVVCDWPPPPVIDHRPTKTEAQILAKMHEVLNRLERMEAATGDAARAEYQLWLAAGGTRATEDAPPPTVVGG